MSKKPVNQDSISPKPVSGPKDPGETPNNEPVAYAVPLSTIQETEPEVDLDDYEPDASGDPPDPEDEYSAEEMGRQIPEIRATLDAYCSTFARNEEVCEAVREAIDLGCTRIGSSAGNNLSLTRPVQEKDFESMDEIDIARAITKDTDDDCPDIPISDDESVIELVKTIDFAPYYNAIELIKARMAYTDEDIEILRNYVSVMERLTQMMTIEDKTYRLIAMERFINTEDVGFVLDNLHRIRKYVEADETLAELGPSGLFDSLINEALHLIATGK